MTRTADPFSRFCAALPAIIAESPSAVTRQREVLEDSFAGPVNYISGPHTVRVEPFRQTSAQDVFDEKGSVSTVLFQLIGYGLPRLVLQGVELAPLFQLNDVVKDQDGNSYRVTAPPLMRGPVVWVTLELRGYEP